MHELTAFQRDILYVIAGLGSPYGLEIKRELEAYRGSAVGHGRLYPNLDELVDAGLVEKGQKDERTNAYSLRPKGKRAIVDRRSWENFYLVNPPSVSIEGADESESCRQ